MGRHNLHWPASLHLNKHKVTTIKHLGSGRISFQLQILLHENMDDRRAETAPAYVRPTLHSLGPDLQVGKGSGCVACGKEHPGGYKKILETSQEGKDCHEHALQWPGLQSVASSPESC